MEVVEPILRGRDSVLRSAALSTKQGSTEGSKAYSNLTGEGVTTLQAGELSGFPVCR